VSGQVRLVEGSHIVITAVATEQWPAVDAVDHHRGAGPELLFLRFIYEYPDADFGQPEDRLVAELRRQAYEQSDIDTVVRIRELAASGELGDYVAPPGSRLPVRPSRSRIGRQPPPGRSCFVTPRNRPMKTLRVLLIGSMARMALRPAA